MTTSTATPRRRSTGRAPSVNLASLRTILTAWFDESTPSIASISKETGTCQATVRKYLRLALGPLPRGKAACMPRGEANIQALLNGVPTEALLGRGRVELLHRRREAGASLDALAKEFGVSRRRVSAVVAPPAPEVVPEAPEPEAVAAEVVPEPEAVAAEAPEVSDDDEDATSPVSAASTPD